MKRPVPLIAAVLLYAVAHAGAQPSPYGTPQPPDVTLAEGKALVTLARAAMTGYLHSRTPADAVEIPETLARLGETRYPVAITLRDDGEPLAREIADAGTTPRSLIAAALRAMRSRHLPDRVTEQVLDALLVEVEVIGKPTEVDTSGAAELDAIRDAVTPGLTGLMQDRGDERAYVLPSEAYLQGMDAEAMRARCLTGIPLTGDMLRMAATWSVFRTRHYVGYPDAAAVWLYGGKILTPSSAIDERAMRLAAMRIAARLAGDQDETGRYVAPGRDETPIFDHLYATWAMSRVARQTGREELAASVRAALAYAGRYLRDADGQTYVAAGSPPKRVAATAMFLLASDGTDGADDAAAVRRRLGNYVRTGLAAAAASPAADDEERNEWASAASVGYLALHSMEAPDAWPVAGDLLQAPGKLDPVPFAWRARALAARPGDRPASPPDMPTLAGHWRGDGPIDARGGFGAYRQPPSVFLTALHAAAVAATPPAGGPDVSARLRDARRFVCQMVYHPREAWFAPDRDAWTGAVRQTPAAAAASVRAAAAAIDTLLTAPPTD